MHASPALPSPSDSVSFIGESQTRFLISRPPILTGLSRCSNPFAPSPFAFVLLLAGLIVSPSWVVAPSFVSRCCAAARGHRSPDDLVAALPERYLHLAAKDLA